MFGATRALRESQPSQTSMYNQKHSLIKIKRVYLLDFFSLTVDSFDLEHILSQLTSRENANLLNIINVLRHYK